MLRSDSRRESRQYRVGEVLHPYLAVIDIADGGVAGGVIRFLQSENGHGREHRIILRTGFAYTEPERTALTGDRREVHCETAFGIGGHRLGETVVIIAGIDLHRLAAGIGGDQLTIYMDRFARYIHRFIGLQRCRKRRERVDGQEIRAVVRIIQLLYMPVLVHYGMEVIVTGFLG